jgi:peptidoglycan/xylan/chitin deacetylase (PgdA/CDA1 family)
MKIIASFDDATVEDLIVSDLMLELGIETTFYFPSWPYEVNEPKGRISLDFAQRRLIAGRHEIGSHTRTHPLLTRISDDLARDEIFKSRDDLQQEFGREISAFCYPRGYANPTIENMVREAGYTHARGVTVGYIYPSENKYYESTTVHVGCNRKEYAGLDWFEYAVKMLDIALQTKENSIYSIFGHGWEIKKNNGWGKLRELCEILRKVR